MIIFQLVAAHLGIFSRHDSMKPRPLWLSHSCLSRHLCPAESVEELGGVPLQRAYVTTFVICSLSVTLSGQVAPGQSLPLLSLCPAFSTTVARLDTHRGPISYQRSLLDTLS